MDSPHKEEYLEIYKQILECTENLEVKIKNSFNDQKQSVIISDSDKFDACSRAEYHYDEILRHVKDIKRRFDKIRYHEKEILKIFDDNNNNCHKRPVVKRHVSLKKEVRQPQMKYLVQWEKYLDENSLVGSNEDLESEVDILPKPIIKKRIKQFEGNDKRQSSTSDKFLDVRLSIVSEKMKQYKELYEGTNENLYDNLDANTQQNDDSLCTFEENYTFEDSKEDLAISLENSTENLLVVNNNSENYLDEHQIEEIQGELVGFKNERFFVNSDAFSQTKNNYVFENQVFELDEDIDTKPKIVEVVYKKKKNR